LQAKLRFKGGEEYNLSLINSLVAFVGISSVAQAKVRSGSPVFNASDPGAMLLQQLAGSLDSEGTRLLDFCSVTGLTDFLGQHHLLTSMAMHLRYPNAHTHWFSSLILHIFASSKEEKFREIITKILLERFIGHRPHPWGVLVTFIELLRGPKYDFWNREFIRAVPEISLLLESVSIIHI
jgi:CCR4-NOT transcription complex subunit 1